MVADAKLAIQSLLEESEKQKLKLSVAKQIKEIQEKRKKWKDKPTLNN